MEEFLHEKKEEFDTENLGCVALGGTGCWNSTECNFGKCVCKGKYGGEYNKAQEDDADATEVIEEEVQTEITEEESVIEGQNDEPEQEAVAVFTEEASENVNEDDVLRETDIASGTDWTLDASGKLTITSNVGMEKWCYERWPSSQYVHPNQEQVKTIEIKSGVTSIMERAFYGCTNLTSITLPESLTSIEENAFLECTNLTSITFPKSLTSIGVSAFEECTSLTSITLPESLTSIENHAFLRCTDLTSITLPESLTSIGQDVFAYCSSLTSITLPETLTSIGWGMFRECTNLTSITLPESLTSIKGRAFEGCTNLISIRLPKKLTSIGAQVFWGCTNLTSVTLPESLTSISMNMFAYCSSLTSITLPESLTSIGQAAFISCSSLTSIRLPELLTSIEPQAFEECTNLTSIMLPESLTSIGQAAFKGCTSLTDITLQCVEPPTLGSSLFSECKFVTENLKGIKVPSGTANAYKDAWTDWVAYIADDSVPSDDRTMAEVVGTAAESALEDINISNATTKEVLQAVIDEAVKEALTAAGFDSSEVTITVENFAKTDATEDVSGSIIGTIKITCGTETVEVPVNKTIAKLSLTDAEKVKVVKTAVETVLETISVSNATTKEALQIAIDKAIEEALTAADINSITVTVENFAKTDATEDVSGSITGTIKIICGTENAEVPVNKTITKLPVTSADMVTTVRIAIEDAVKKAVDAALEGVEVTNDNAEEIANKIAQEVIPTAIEKALETADVNTSDVAIGEVDIEINLATKDDDGSIKIIVPVTSTKDGVQSENAEVLITITKPDEGGVPDKDAEKAQEVVEDALNKIEITNGTTPKDIIDVIGDAIKDAFGDDAKVDGIEEFDKEDATQDASGNLKIKIKLIINGKTIYVIVNVPIDKLSSKTGVYVRFMDYDKLGTDSKPCYKYTGTAIKPVVEVYHNETLLTLGSDYTISYKNNTKVGNQAALTVKGKGNFTGTSNVVNFTIINADIDMDTKHPTKMTVVAGTKITPVIMHGTKQLMSKDYELTGVGLDNGKYASVTTDNMFNTLIVKGIGSYEGSSFDIQVRVIDKSAAKKLAVAVDKNFKPVYDGNALNLANLFRSDSNKNGVLVVTDSKDKTKLLKEGEDFTVVCTSSLTNAGTVKFTLTGMGEYVGSVSKTFKISPLKVTDGNQFAVTFDENKSYEYKAFGTTVDNLSVKYLGVADSETDDQILRQGVDYKVSYGNNRKVSDTKEAELRITFLGNYKGSVAVAKPFKIKAAKLSAQNTVVTVPDKVYSKADKSYKSMPIVTVDGMTIKASDYAVSYKWATESKAQNDANYFADEKVKITIAEGDSYAKVKVAIMPKGSYTLADDAVLEGEYYVRKVDSAIDISKAKVTFHDKVGNQLKNLEYNGAAFYTPEGNNSSVENAPESVNAVYISVSVKDKIVDPSLYDVVWTNAIVKGKATVVICGKGTVTAQGTAVGSKNQSISIKQMTLKGRNLKFFMEKAVENLKNVFS